MALSVIWAKITRGWLTHDYKKSSFDWLTP